LRLESQEQKQRRKEKKKVVFFSSFLLLAFFFTSPVEARATGAKGKERMLHDYGPQHILPV
jgi:hypothetical protein